MSRDEIIHELKEILGNVVIIESESIDSINEKTDFVKDLGVPSAEFINLLLDIEEHFDIEFDDKEIAEIGSSVHEMVDLIEVKLSLKHV